jgi:hypothetical protein
MTLKNTPQLADLHWTRDQRAAECGTWQHRTLSRGRLTWSHGLEAAVPANKLPQNHSLEHAANDISCLDMISLITKLQVGYFDKSTSSF